jgi:high-affinity nickel-transport protein
VKERLGWLYAGLLAANAAAWLWAALTLRHNAGLLGMALVAYSLGLRHAVDADHIAAIDNVTRKLIQERRPALSSGLWFSLGHSTVVVIGAALLAGAAVRMNGWGEWRSFGGVLGTCISGFFLLGIGLANLAVWRSLRTRFRQLRRGDGGPDTNFDWTQPGGGLLARLYRPLFARMRASWHMYPLGFLFGLGFDTATEVGLLAIAAAEAARGLKLEAVLVFPALFAAGMALVDTSDSVLMAGAYGWAFAKPMRRMFYNLTVTGLSAGMALLVGAIELLGLAGGARWLNDHFTALGYGIIGLFVLSWLAALGVYRWQRLDEVAE